MLALQQIDPGSHVLPSSLLFGNIVHSHPILYGIDTVDILVFRLSLDSLVAAVVSTSLRVRTVSGVPVASVLAAVLILDVVQPPPGGLDGHGSCFIGAAL